MDEVIYGTSADAIDEKTVADGWKPDGFVELYGVNPGAACLLIQFVMAVPAIPCATDATNIGSVSV